jgi:hypothetical protein
MIRALVPIATAALVTSSAFAGGEQTVNAVANAYQNFNTYQATWVVDHEFVQGQPQVRSEIEVAFDRPSNRFLMRETTFELVNGDWIVQPGGRLLVNDGTNIQWGERSQNAGATWTTSNVAVGGASSIEIRKQLQRSQVDDLQLLTGIAPSQIWTGKIEEGFGSSGFRIVTPSKTNSALVNVQSEHNIIELVVFGNGRTQSLKTFQINEPIRSSLFDFATQQAAIDAIQSRQARS